MILGHPTKVAIDAARTAGKIMLRMETRRADFTYKGQHDILSATDLACERAILSLLRSRFPHHGILSEEAGKVKDARYLWVVDPLDGTANFSMGLEEYCTSISLMDGDLAVLGVVYQPKLKRLFVAQRGKGATLNGKRIRVSSTSALSRAAVATDQSHALPSLRANLATLSRLAPKVRDVRLLGSSALLMCRIAQGQFDGYVKHNFNLWDFAAGALIVEEAGGKATDLRGRPICKETKDIIATNGALHAAMLRAVKG